MIAATPAAAPPRRPRVKPAKPYEGFPLFPHATGRWAKKIGGRFAFFGPWDDPFGALERFTAQRDALYVERCGPARTFAHEAPRATAAPTATLDRRAPSSRPAANVGQRASPAPTQDLSLGSQGSAGLTVREMVNHFLTAKNRKMTAGELGKRAFIDYHAVCGRLIPSLGAHRAVVDLTPAHFSSLRAERAKRFGPLVLGIEIGRVRTVFKHLYQVRVMPESTLSKEPAVKLVDRWAKMEAQRQELRGEQGDLEAQIDEVRTALIDVAKREGLELIAGRDKEVVVKQIERIMFPRKGEEPEKAAELEAALRATKWWKNLSTLNTAQLKVAWEAGAESNSDLRKLLKRFVWTEEDVTARLRDRRDRKP